MNTNQQQNNQEVILGAEIDSIDIFGKPFTTELETKPEQKPEVKEEEVLETKPKVEEGKEKPVVEVEESTSLFETKEEKEAREKKAGVNKEKTEVKSEEGEDDVDYNSVYKAFVATGEWEEVEIEGEDKNIDKETFNYIAKEQAKRKREKVKEEVFKDLSEDEKAYFEHKKNGGNYLEFLKAHSFKQQAENIDISTDAGKKNAIYAYYKNIVGWSDEKTKNYINRIEKELELQQEAESAKEEIEKVTKADFEKVKENARQAKEARDVAENKFKEDVKTALKTEKIDTKKVNSIIRDVTDRDERNLSVIDKKYLEIRNNPEKIAELHSFLLDYENFTKKVSQKEVNKKGLEEFKKITFNKSGKKTEGREARVEKEESDLLL